MSLLSGKTTFGDILDKIRKEAKGNTAELGRRFEHLIKNYFKADALRIIEFQNVWLWGEDSCLGKDSVEKMFGNKTKKDYGIDLVAQKMDGSLCAIQCKCYARDAKLEKKDVEGFLALASAKSNNKKIFESMIFVWTGHEITPGAAVVLEGHNCEVLNYHKLKKSSVDWDSLLGNKPRRNIGFKLRYHQQCAVDKVISGFDDNDRGKLIMACGTGKTFITLKIAEHQAGGGGAVLYLVPSISFTADQK